MLLGCFLLFFNLGNYALWDDEAGTALHGIAVSRTGDTGALVGENLVAFRNGVALKGLKDRTVSPLQYYICAPFMMVDPHSSYWARMPFSVAGLIALGLFLYWIHSSNSDWYEKAAYTLCVLLSVSLFLYFRQCRYYSLVLLSETLVLCGYLHRGRSIIHVVLLNTGFLEIGRAHV